mmetsp:Transcript_74224/g.131244  ORF Transcript_74224/g.131244 Transcript_74224/m.131244 type:complete len:434 (-) Transcript_74224:81-1382(-)
MGIQMLSLTPFTQHYDWGKPRNQSIIAELTGQCKANGADESPSDTKPFAEMWMGDHPSGPSSVKTPSSGNKKFSMHGSSLNDVLQCSPSVLGKQLARDGKLPFLLKVLSIHKALSIQAHPDRARAAKLHAERPEIYKDPNHKPEIAIALTDDFQALCGFRPVSELVAIMAHVPELVAVVGEEASKELSNSLGDRSKESDALRKAYTRMMHSSEEVVRKQVQLLKTRAEAGAGDRSPVSLKETFALVSKLYAQYGDDIGIFSIFFMNHVHMKVGECLYMAQNVPHAYLSGDIVECMACSDNVVRGGLTPKFKDVEVLCEMLDYRGGPPAVVKPVQLDDGVRLYADPDIEEFQVTHLHMAKGGCLRRLFSKEGPAMGFACKGAGSLTISGEVQEIGPGKVFMLAAGVEPELKAATDLEFFVASCPPQYFRPPPRK